jgi:hypothetical protein
VEKEFVQMDGANRKREEELCGECEVPSTRDVYTMRKKLNGLILGELDKNNGEMWGACPVLYWKAWNACYSRGNGYEPVYIAKLSSYRKKRYTVEELPKQILRRGPVPARQEGSEKDIIELMKAIYKKYGWEKYAQFDNKGGINLPYVLLKAKNVTDKDIREKKYKKGRPIAPGTKHPLKRLLHYAGRAWSFITTQIPGEHFVINKCNAVPDFLRESEGLKEKGKLRMEVMDIEGCFPNMPKETIRFAMRKVASEIKREKGVEGVWVPKHSDTYPCSWKEKKRCQMQFFPFQVLLEIMEFSLDFAFIKAKDGRIYKQLHGIPMGDPLSPGMTIGTCAWMENEWMQSLKEEDKMRFRAKRFMDDVLMIMAEREDWDTEKFLKDFKKSECYQTPLKLENGTANTFLECRYETDGSKIRFKLKNDNEKGDKKIWRYQHYESCSAYNPLRAHLNARKPSGMAIYKSEQP